MHNVNTQTHISCSSRSDKANSFLLCLLLGISLLLLRSLNLGDVHLSTGLGGSNGRSLMSRLANEPQLLEQGLIHIELGVVRRQQLITVEDGIGTGREHHVLLGIRKAQTTSRQTDHGTGHHDAGSGDHTGHVECIDVANVIVLFLGIAKGGALDTDKGIDGNRLWMHGEGGQNVEETNAVIILLTKAQNTTAADGNTSIADVGNGLETVLVRSGGDDVGVVFRTGVEVVVVGSEAGLLELLGLLGVQHAKGAADLKAHAVDATDHVEDVSEGVLLVAQLAPRGAHAEAGGTSLLGPPGGLEDLLHLHGGGGLDEGLVAGGLGAVRAVLHATAGLDGEEGALLHFGGIPVHAMDGRGAVHELVEGELVDLGDLLLGPVVTDAGGDSPHASRGLVGVEGVALSLVVGKSIGGSSGSSIDSIGGSGRGNISVHYNIVRRNGRGERPGAGRHKPSGVATTSPRDGGSTSNSSDCCRRHDSDSNCCNFQQVPFPVMRTPNANCVVKKMSSRCVNVFVTIQRQL